jgi:hypothetical protein
MKNTFGKLGFGLAGAVAAVGLMSAGVQTAQAQIEISPPVITLDANSTLTNPIYDWTYTLTLQPITGGASDAVNSEFGLALASDNELTKSGASGSYYTTNLTGTWTNSFNNSDFYGTSTTASALSGGVIGTLTLVSGTDHATKVGYYGFIATGSSGDPTGISAVLSSSNSQATDFASYNVESGANTSTNFYGQGVFTPSQSGTTVLSPLPLPAAVWPGLLTLAGMAVVGGLRLRRKAV